MAGLVIDILVMFVVKNCIRGFLSIKSRRWERRPATLVDAMMLDPFWGCPTVKVRYRLGTNAEQSGASEVPFYLRRSATQCAELLSEHHAIIVRVNPTHPEEVFFSQDDQRGVSVGMSA